MSIDTILDLTGVDPQYQVTDEPIELAPNRIFMPEFGAFFTQSVVLKDNAANRILTPYVDYLFLQLDPTATAKAGQEVSLYIGVKNPAVSNDLTLLSYQFIGGFYTHYRELVQPVLTAFDADLNTLVNNQVIHSPELFPDDHLLKTNVSSFGWEFVVWAIESVIRALLVGDEEDHQAIRDRINGVLAIIDQAIPNGLAMIQAHIDDKNDPHQVTATQLSVYTQTEFLQILLDYLGVLEQAYDTLRFGNETYASILSQIRQNLDASLITVNLVPYSKMMSGYNPNGGLQVLIGTGWVNAQTFLNTAEPVYYYGESVDQLKSTFQNYPVGTTVSMINILYTYLGNPYGNGGYDTMVRARETYRKIGSGYHDWALQYR